MVSFPEIPAIKEFPFKTYLSFEPLLLYYGKKVEEPTFRYRKERFMKLLERLQNTKELLGDIADVGAINKHPYEVSDLMSMLFPAAYWDRDYSAAIAPFNMNPFYATPGYEGLFLRSDPSEITTNITDTEFLFGKTLNAYILIAKKFYDIDIEFDYPLVYSVQDPATKLARYFQINFDPRFCDVRLVGELPVLTEKEKLRLRQLPAYLPLWMNLLPPERFEFYGLVLITANEITEQQTLSALKSDLLSKNSFLTKEGFGQVQERVRSFMKLADLKLSISTVRNEQVWTSCEETLDTGTPMFAGPGCCDIREFRDSIYYTSFEADKPITIPDLSMQSPRSKHEDELVSSGVQSVYVSPLKVDNEKIGVLVLTSPNKADLNTISTLKMGELLPLFGIALKRTINGVENRVESEMRRQFTAIHPAVEWRFRDAALKMVQNGSSKPEEIVFKNVYPLYAQTDIRGSSDERNRAITADLIEQLQLARRIIELSKRYKDLPYLDSLLRRIDRRIGSLQEGITSGDEAAIIDFLQQDVESYFNHLSTFGFDVHDAVRSYQESLDVVHGILYNRRKEYEESVAAINKVVSEYLDEEENKAQQMFPHYFEKHVSDGIEMSIYVGQSLVNDREFDILYLRNFRLWQLMTLTGLARKTKELIPSLKVPLETAHLTLVQNFPLSVRFRQDEKLFDVDGAYNIRYEILKKRIDKAFIKGTNERLTQPGEIAIVYTSNRERNEYIEYINYLIAKGELLDGIEELEVEDLQGTYGLRALRVGVNFKRVSSEIEVPESVLKAIKTMAAVAS